MAWGYNYEGQCSVPSGLTGVVAIAAGLYNSLALKADGTVVAWGYNSRQQWMIPAQLKGVVAIAAGDTHSLALKDDGRVVAWGNNANGQATVPEGLTGVIAIAAGENHSLALKSDGTVVAWGDNSYGQTTVPAGLAGVTAIAAGGGHSIALKGDSTLAVWGANFSGEGTVPDSLAGREPGTVSYDAATQTATFTPALPFTAGTTYYATVAGVTAQNGVGLASPFTWKFTTYDLEITRYVLPPAATGMGYSQTVGAVGGVAPYTWSIAGGSLPPWAALDSATGLIAGTPTEPGTYSFTVRVTDAAGIAFSKAFTLVTHPTVSWYRPADGAVAPVATTVQATFSDPLAPATVSTGSFFLSGSGAPPKAIAAGEIHSLALKADGTVMAWGANSYGQTSVPAGLTGVTTIVGGTNHSLALQEDGTVTAWGANSFGESTVPAGLTGVVAIAAGDRNSLVLKEDGTVVPWGLTIAGGTTIPTGLSRVVVIAAGYYHSLALKVDSTVVAWGDNRYGQSTIPAGLSGIIAIAGGAYHSLALKGDGTVVAWGDNRYGQATVPAGLTGVVAVAAGGAHSLALKGDGTVVAWGDDATGQSAVPTGLTGVVAIAGQGNHSLALKNDMTMVAWGSNVVGESIVPLGLNVRVEGTVSYDIAARTATFTPSAPLTAGATYFATVTGITSETGWGLAAPFTWRFSTYNLNITPSVLPAAPIATAYNQTLAATGGAAPYTWSIAAGSLPAGVSLNSVSGIISGTPSTAGTFTFTVLVTDANAVTFSRPYTIIVYSPLSLATATLPTSLTGTAYSQTLAAAGGIVPYAWSIASGALPAGLSLDAATGAITGTPTIVGTSSITFRVTDATTATASKTLSITVNPGPLSVSSANMPDGYVTFPYTATMAANGGTYLYTWSIASGTLPSGLTLTSGTGVISGTPTAVGSVNVTFRVTDAGNVTATKLLTIAITTRPTVTGYQPANGAIVPVTATVQATFSEPLDPATVTSGSLTLSSVNSSKAIATGPSHSLALKTVSTVVAWGSNSYGQTTVPAGLTGVTAIAGGGGHSLALKGDGSVVAWGNNSKGQRTVPTGLNGVTAIVAGGSHSLALKADGTVVAWGDNAYSQSSNLTGLSGVTAIAAGPLYSLALKGDGTVVASGTYQNGQSPAPPVGLTGVRAIAAGGYHSLALKSDGTVVAWGDNTDGQTTVPAGLTGVVAITAGERHSLALKSDGTVVAWGNNGYGQTTVPAGLTGVTAISAWGNHTLALKMDRTVVVWGSNSYGQTTLPESLYARENGAVSYDAGAWTVTYTPPALLSAGTTYNATVAGVTSQTGVGLAAPFTWSFTTEGTLLSITTGALQSGGKDVRYDQILAATGGVAPYTWSIDSGNLPVGLSLNTATGAITGIPFASGNSSITFKVTDAASATDTKSVSITINELPAIRIPGTFARYFNLLQSAYDTLSDGETIEMGGVDLYENLEFNRAVNAVLQGGYSNDFSMVDSVTNIHGSLTVSQGTVVIDNLVLLP